MVSAQTIKFMWNKIKSDTNLALNIQLMHLFIRVFIRHRRSENSPSTAQNSPGKFHSFPERALLFHNNYSPITLHCSPAICTTILNENPAL